MSLTVVTLTVNAQTTIWSSDCEDLTGWIADDIDGDGQNWFYYTGGDTIGFQPGQFIASPSMSASPDQVMRTPAINIPGNANDLTLTYRVAASNDLSYLETYAVYVQEVGVGSRFDNKIHEATLADGGANSAFLETISIPSNFAGKNVYFHFRHYNTSNQEFLMVDDVAVESGSTLSIGDTSFEQFSIYPNPVKTELNFRSNENISSAEIYNLLGQKVQSYNKDALLDDQIDVTNLQAGNYLIKVTINSNTQIFRFIKN